MTLSPFTWPSTLARTVSFTVNDGAANSNTATVTITVNPLNDAPVAVDDAYATDEDTTLTVPAVGVLGNDSDVDGDPLTAVLVSGPAHGTLTLGGDGSFTYTPEANYFGPDGFTYLANDGTADSNVATVAITVNAVNDAPVVFDPGRNGGQVWEPKNYDGKYEGPMKMRRALAKSKNLVTVRVLQAIGPRMFPLTLSGVGKGIDALRH